MIQIILLLFFCNNSYSLSFDEFITSFQSNSIKLMELKSEKQVNEAEYQEAKSAWYPQVSFNMGYLNSKSPAASRGLDFPGLNTLNNKYFTASLNLDQVVYAGGRISNNIKLKKTQLQFADLLYQNQKQHLSQQALFLALSWKFSQENLLILQESLKMQTRFLSLVKRRLRSGLARSYDYDKTLGDKTAYELRIEQIKQTNENTLQQLIEETGLSEVQLKQLQLPQVKDLKITGTVSETQNNIEIKSLQAEEELVGRGLMIENAKHKPSLSLGASLGRESVNFSDLSDNSNNTRSLYVNFKVPLFSGFSSKHLRQKNKMKMYSVEKKQKALMRNIKIKSEQVRDRLEKNKILVEKSEAWKEAASRGLKRVLNSYQMGQVENSQVVLMQSDFERASVSYLDLIQLYYKDYIAWNSIQGNNIEDIF